MKDYPAVSKWALGLSKRSEFMTAVWKASDDGGFPSFQKFLLRSRKPLPLANISSQARKDTDSATHPVKEGKAPPTGSSSSQEKKSSGAASKGNKGNKGGGSAKAGKSPQETRKSVNGTASPVSWVGMQSWCVCA